MIFLLPDNYDLRVSLQLDAYMETPCLYFIDKFLELDSFDLPFFEKHEFEHFFIDIPSGIRFGNRMESIFEYVVTRSNNFKITSKNLQIVKDKITLGEFDFILENTLRHKTYHVEIANKFYLFDDSMENEYSKWIGPNRNDNLFLKLKKLKEKQFPLIRNDAAINKLNSIGVDTSKIVQKINFKAQLFIPYKSNHSFKGIETSGYYLYLNQFKSSSFKNYQYFLPEKQDWQINPKHCEIWFDHTSILESIHLHFEIKKSPLIWIKKTETVFERVFVVWW